jgi:hypothetical protein
VSPFRVFLAVLLLGIAVAGAVEVATNVKVTQTRYVPGTGASGPVRVRAKVKRRPSWAVPVAVLVGFVGLAASAGIVASGYQRHARLFR